METKNPSTIDRLAAANATEEKVRLTSLTLEESARLFEELCSIFHAEFDYVPAKKRNPAGLIKYWKK